MVDLRRKKVIKNNPKLFEKTVKTAINTHIQAMLSSRGYNFLGILTDLSRN